MSGDLRPLLPVELPAAAARRLGVAPEDLVPAGTGDFCLAFRLGTVIVRIARHPEAEAALRRETRVLTAIADRLPLPVPRLGLHDLPQGPVFTVHEAIGGEVLTRDRWTGLPSPARDRAVGDLAEFLRALHGLPTAIVADCGLPRLGFRRSAGQLRARLGRDLEESLTRRLAALLSEWESNPAAEERADAVLHADLAPGHVHFDPATGALTGIIDFGDVAIGDPARDFVFLHEDFGEEFLTEVLQRYSGPAPPVDHVAVRRWYLLEALDWTLRMRNEGRREEVRHGIAEVTRELSREEGS